MPVDHVISQVPRAGNSGPEGTPVYLYVSIGPMPDVDGVDDAVEDSGPNGGDANNDTILDSLQADVASIPNSIDG